MGNTIRLKRRVSGPSGAPSTLKNAECAFSEVDDVLWYGKGVGQDGNATSIIAIGGEGVFATKSWVTSAVSAVDVSSQLANYLLKTDAASAYLTKADAGSTYLTISNASSTYLTQASAASTYLTQTSAASTYLTQANAASTYLTQANAASTYAPLESPAFTGTPSLPSGTTATTQTAGDNSTKLATTAYVSAAISSLVNGAPGVLDTLGEIAQALASDASFSTTITNSLATKADRTLSNLSDLAASRSNLGLGSMAVQSASSVNITGGQIDGCDISGGTY